MQFLIQLIISSCLAFTCLGVDAFASTPSTSWHLEKETPLIKVFSRAKTGTPYTEIRAETIVSSPLKKLVCFLQDETINQQWVPYSGGIRIVDQPDTHTSYVHFIMNATWPFKNRDSVAKFTLSQESATQAITISMVSTPKKIPLTANHVRITDFYGHWQLTPMTVDSTKITYQHFVDPGGYIPAWLSNSLAYETTLQSLLNVHSLIQGYTHDPQEYPFFNAFNPTTTP